MFRKWSLSETERKNIMSKKQITILSLFVLIAFPSSVLSERLKQSEYAPGEVLVKFRPGISSSVARATHRSIGFALIKQFRRIRVDHVKIPDDRSVEGAIAAYRLHPDVEYVEPNYYRYATDVPGPLFPDDHLFGLMWGLDNTGQTGGTFDADIDCPEAWDIQTGSTDVVIAVVDTGVDLDHVDLADNIWSNTDEWSGDADGDGFPGVGAVDDDGDAPSDAESDPNDGIDNDGDGLVDENGIDFRDEDVMAADYDQDGDTLVGSDGEYGTKDDDEDDIALAANDDDENGYADDINGWDFVNDDNAPDDDNSDKYHGTHVAGTIGAVSDNAIGVTGVSWSASIMPLKTFNQGGGGFVSDEIKAIDYAIENGAQIINASFGGGNFVSSEYSAIESAGAAGILFVAAAGNYYDPDGDGLLDSPVYPARYDLANIIAVAATDHNDALASFSNYGATSVDVAAPGVNILSTKAGDSYQYLSGTSMATPHVSGLAALIWAEHPGFLYDDIKDRILNGVDVLPALTGKMLMAGRINAHNSINPALGEPDAPGGLMAGAISSSQVDLSWTDNAADESGFKIERAFVSGGPYTHVATVGADVESHSDMGAREATTNYYQVLAFNSAGDSDASNEAGATTYPAAPSGLSATAVSTERINLSWADNSAGETGFKIEQKEAGGTYSEIAMVGANVKTFSSTGLDTHTTYYYRVRAYSSIGDSIYSKEAHATTFAISAASGDESDGDVGDSDRDDSNISSDGDQITKTGGGGGGGGCFVDTVVYKSVTTPLRWPGMKAW
jgi:subtilisin family serine protease